jgi:hypothetical protein
MKNVLSIMSTLFIGLTLTLTACGKDKRPATTEPMAAEPAAAEPMPAEPMDGDKPMAEEKPMAEPMAGDKMKAGGAGGW